MQKKFSVFCVRFPSLTPIFSPYPSSLPVPNPGIDRLLRANYDNFFYHLIRFPKKKRKKKDFFYLGVNVHFSSHGKKREEKRRYFRGSLSSNLTLGRKWAYNLIILPYLKRWRKKLHFSCKNAAPPSPPFLSTSGSNFTGQEKNFQTHFIFPREREKNLPFFVFLLFMQKKTALTSCKKNNTTSFFDLFRVLSGKSGVGNVWRNFSLCVNMDVRVCVGKCKVSGIDGGWRQEKKKDKPSVHIFDLQTSSSTCWKGVSKTRAGGDVSKFCD